MPNVQQLAENISTSYIQPMKRILYSRKAAKALARVPGPVMRRIDGKMRQYAEEPHALGNNLKRLKGSGILRLRVGDWRILFTETETTLLVLAIGPRGDIYEREP